MLGLGRLFSCTRAWTPELPKWMRDLSLEWCYRLWLEPGRLWKRYLVTNSIFLGLFLKHGIHRLLGRWGGRAFDEMADPSTDPLVPGLHPVCMDWTQGPGHQEDRFDGMAS